MKTMRVVFDAVLLIAAIILLSCQSSDKATAQYVLQNAYPNLTKFSSPLCMQTIPDGSNRFVVLQQGGKVYSVFNTPTVSDAGLFLDLTAKVISGGETGLLGCAFHPKYAQNHFVYFNYTANVSGQLTSFISRFTVSGDNFDTILLASEQVLLTIDQPFSNHNGGCLQFGPDGYLYAGFGDGGSGGDPLANGQNRSVLLGKILRLDVDHPADGKNYGIPSTNPFKGNSSGFKEEIYAYGLRNPWRFSFDSQTGKLWCGDVGQGTWEEIDTIELGKNYGWNIMEGKHCYEATNCDQTGLRLPIWEYSHSDGVSITGGYVYHGNKLPELQNKYIYADLSGKVWALTPEATISNQSLATANYGISSFGVTPDGEVVIIHLSSGQLLKIANTNSVSENKAPETFRIRLTTNRIVRSVSTFLGYIDISSSPKAVSCSLVDMLGNQWPITMLSAPSNMGELPIDLKSMGTNLTPGMYLLRVSDGEQAASEKIIVE